MKRILKWYNQKLEYFSRNWCSVYTLFMILQLNWGIQVENKFIINTLVEAQKDKVWNEARGSYYNTIYKWFTEKIYERTEVEVKIKALDIRSEEFKKLSENGYAFWIWLKYWWRFRNKAVSDGVIDEDDILEFDWWAELWHALTYYQWYILDSLWGKLLKCDYDTLVRMVNMGIFWSTGRTLYLTDRLLDKYLKWYQKWERITHVELLPPADQAAIARASKLRVFKR